MSTDDPRVPDRPSAARRAIRATTAALSRWSGPIRIILLVLIVVFAVYAIATSWDDVSASLIDMGPVLIGGSAAVLVLSLAGHFVSWLAILRALGAPRLPLPAAAAISTTSQVAKYMPGSVWTAVVQADLGRRHGIAGRITLASYALALLVSLSVGSILSLLVFLGPAPLWVHALSVAAALCGVALLLSLFHPSLLRSVLDKVFRRFSGEPMPERISPGLLGIGVVAAGIGWLLSGLQSWMLASRLGAGIEDLPFVVGAIVLSWVVGLVIIILPAGAGAREAVLVLTLGQVVGTAEALTIAVLTRFVQIIVELLLAAVFGLPYGHAALRARRKGSTV